MKQLFVFGFGYSARALSKHLTGQDWQIEGTMREANTRGLMVWPGDNPILALNRASHVLISIAPNAAGDPVLREIGEYFRSNAHRFDWVGYLSTTGVYGDHQGGWVDEATPVAPSTMRGKLRVAAEQDWQAIPNLPLHIFRLAGIYGPGRGPFAKLQAGTARRIVKSGQYFSRIHVEDLAQIIAASMARPDPGAIYNVCDDLAAPPEDVIAYAARLLDLPVPVAEEFETAEMTPMARSFYAESKKVRNDRIKSDLGIALKYPDYKSGLQAILAKSSL